MNLSPEHHLPVYIVVLIVMLHDALPHPCLHRRLLAALSVAHGGLGKTLLSHILVKIMVKIVAKVVDNFIVFWAGFFCD